MVALSGNIHNNGGHSMSKVKAIDAANWFVNRAEVERQENFGEGISNMKLQKVLYFAQAAHLAVENEPLFSEEILAWKYGPVIREVYEEFKGSRSSAIKNPSSDRFTKLDNETTGFLEEVWQLFGKYSAGKLVEMTHSHTPWRSAFSGSNNDTVITKNAMKAYYKDVFVRSV